MREILFRGKRIDNSEWVEGNFCMDAIEQLYGCNTGMDGFIRRFNPEIHKSNMFEVDRETVGQFTGLTDKNGVKIFEGDIAHVKARSCSFTGCVIYWPEEARYVCKTKFDMRYAICNKFEFEVIGNIYDNPELLEVSRND